MIGEINSKLPQLENLLSGHFQKFSKFRDKCLISLEKVALLMISFFNNLKAYSQRAYSQTFNSQTFNVSEMRVFSSPSSFQSGNNNNSNISPRARAAQLIKKTESESSVPPFSTHNTKVPSSKLHQFKQLLNKPQKLKSDEFNPKHDPSSFIIDSNSSIVFHKKTGKYIYITEAPPIKNLVISGGGAKGVILPGVVKAFEEFKVGNLSFRDELVYIVGSSVGAHIAAFIAAGMPSDDMITATSEDFIALFGKGIGPFKKDGKPLLNFIRTQLKKAISNNLKNIFNVADLENIADVKKLVQTQLQKNGRHKNNDEIEVLSTKIEGTLKFLKSNDVDPMPFTFLMLQGLRELEPKIFKDLTVTATCRETGTTLYFDVDKTPNSDVPFVTFTSGLLPIMFSEAPMDPKLLAPGYTNLPNNISFVDGGYLDNIPFTALDDKQGKDTKHNRGEAGQNLQTLALIFDETKRTLDQQSPFLDVRTREHTLYNSSNLIERLVRDQFPKYFAGIATQERNTLRKENRLEEMRDKFPHRMIPLLVELTTRDFAKAKEQQAEYVQRGYTQAMDYLNLHVGAAVSRSFDSAEALLQYLPEKEQSAVAPWLEKNKHHA